MTHVLILLGAPGSGKGTQAARLAQAIALPHVSTGDLFRENVDRKTELGVRAQSFMEKGELVPDDVVLDMLFARVSADDCARGYVLDGFPRTVPQAEALERRLGAGVELDVVLLEVSDEEIRRRAAKRGRSDDAPEIVTKRLAEYRAKTAPLIGYYTERGLLHEIDGQRAPDVVFQDLLDLVQKVGEES